ncbi:putative Ig domain-containing protein, partial [Pararhodobacter sp. SW119]|uniref:putative Ig domain-containing protein n=1 Tax=Pararhodobacter sp. SW119 TaxID=2780075 RepID=UPI001ADF34AB
GATQTADLSIAVVHPEMGLTLSQSSASFTRDEAITPITASATGGDETYLFSVAPALPAGIMLDASTGSISGTPRAAQTSRAYTITATDGAGRTRAAQLRIAVIENDSRVQEVFEEATTSFMTARAERLLAMEPRGYRFENRRSATGITEVAGRANDNMMMLRFAGNHVSHDGRWHAWMEAEFSRHSVESRTFARRTGEFGMASAGVDYLVTPRLAFGVMIQFDRARESARDISGISGHGWMVGPYLTGEITENVFFTLRGALGATRNNAAIDVYSDGSDWFEGSFQTRRALVRASIYGVHRLESGLEISPELDIAWIRDRQQGYSVTDGISAVAVAGTTVELGRLTLSTLLEMPTQGERAMIFVRPGMTWNFHRNNAHAIERASGSLELGMRTGPIANWQGVIALRVDNIGNAGRRAQSIRLGLSTRF